jgi:hypothetical protein
MINDLIARDGYFQRQLYEDPLNLILTLWNADNGDFAKALEMLKKVRCIPQDFYLKEELVKKALEKDQPEWAFTFANKDWSYHRIRDIKNIINYNIKNNRSFDLDLLLEKSIKDLPEYQWNDSKVSELISIAKMYYQFGVSEKFRKFMMMAEKIAETDTHTQSSSFVKIAKAYMETGYYEKAHEMANKSNSPYIKSELTMNLIIKTIKSGEVDEAIKMAWKIDKAKSIYIGIIVAKHLIEFGYTDKAFELIENFISQGKNVYDSAYSYEFYQSYISIIEKCMELNRFDIAFKMLHLIEFNSDFANILIKLNEKTIATNYNPTEDDYYWLRKTIHKGEYFCKHPLSKEQEFKRTYKTKFKV